VSALGARIGVLALIAAGAAAVVPAATVPIIQGGRMDSVRASAAPWRAREPDSAVDNLVAEALRRPLFRPARRPAALGFDPARAVQAASGESAPPVERPPLALSGIVWGAEPAAIVEGMPGAEGSTVLRRGESSSGIRVARIERARVVLVGRDTSWTLEVREPWR
jgi:hypothetical protein